MSGMVKSLVIYVITATLIDEYVNHVVKDHTGLKVCHNNRTDLDAFEEKTRREWEQFLKRRQKEYLKHLYEPGFDGLPPIITS